jgi:hypothetical protein
MAILNRIITVLLIISLQACGAGTQSLLGSLSNHSNTNGPAVGPTTSTAIEKTQSAQKTTPPTRDLDIVLPAFDPGITNKADSDTPIWPELRRAEANLFAVELKKALESTNKFGAVRVTPDRSATGTLCHGTH